MQWPCMRPRTLSALRGMGVEGARLEHVVEGEVQEAEGCELGEAGGDLLEGVLREVQRGEPGQAVQRRQLHALRSGRISQRHALHSTRPGVSTGVQGPAARSRVHPRSAWASAWACKMRGLLLEQGSTSALHGRQVGHGS